jgi:hypothetical protein
MSIPSRLKESIIRRPLDIMALVMSIPLVLIGVYFESPVYRVLPEDSFLDVLVNSDSGRGVIALVYFIPFVLIALGLWKKSDSLRSKGTFALFLVYVFKTGLRLALLGFTYTPWLLTATFAVLSAIIHLYAKWVGDG